MIKQEKKKNEASFENPNFHENKKHSSIKVKRKN